MPEIWKHASKDKPCIVCGKPDWCSFGDRAMKCQRIASAHSCPSGGWYHFYDGPTHREFSTSIKHEIPQKIDAEAIMESWRQTTIAFTLNYFARDIGVKAECLMRLGAAYSIRFAALAFPMRDAQGVCGIRLRNMSGFKWAVRGSKQGLFIPDNFATAQDTVYLPEGPTSTAAALSLGLYAIGRPSCNTGGNILKAIIPYLRNKGVRRAVIVADNDELKQSGDKQWRPGIEGAVKLKKELGMLSVIWIPPSPFKDMRDFLKGGGTKEIIESDVRNKVWGIK